MKNIAFKMGMALAGALAVFSLRAETVIDITGAGAEKFTVSAQVSGNPEFTKYLQRNLVLSGCFRVAAGGAIKVTGTVGGSIRVEGLGKALTLGSSAADAAQARGEARRLADKMCEVYANARGFASTPIAFVLKTGDGEELCVGYADGADTRQLTTDRRASVGPRWKDARTIYYTGYLNNAPQVFEIDIETGRRSLAFGFGGLTTGGAVSPDGSRVALILSKPFRNPELCVINPRGDSYVRLTKTPKGNEGQPAWSPDGRKIVYVSDESRRQHLYIIDVATREKRRLTANGTRNVDPDWGRDGRIAYVTRRGGDNCVAVVEPAEGDKAARLVTPPGRWEHPTWAPDMRHLVVENDGALYLVDTMENGDAPQRLFRAGGKCITPSMAR